MIDKIRLNKIILSSFILLSISVIFSIISVKFIGFFIKDTYSFMMTVQPANFRNYTSISSSSFRIHYYPGLIFFGISFILSITGIILFIIGYFSMRSINVDQKQKEIEFDSGNVIFNISFAIFGIVIALLILALTKFIIFQQYISSIVPITGISNKSSYTVNLIRFDENYYLTAQINWVALILIIIGIVLFATGFFVKKMTTKRKTQEKYSYTIELDRTQFNEVKDAFVKFGIYLIIFGSFLIIQFIAAITENSMYSHGLIKYYNVELLSYINWIFPIVATIILIFIVYMVKKISILAKNPKSSRIIAVFIVWLIFYLIMTITNVAFLIITVLPPISYNFWAHRNIISNNFLQINCIAMILATIFQLLSWIFMYSFILKTRNLFPIKYKNIFLRYLIVLMIFTGIEILPYLFAWLNHFGFSIPMYRYLYLYLSGPTTGDIILYLVMPGYVNIIVFIGYLLLGIHLIKLKSSITQNIDAQNRNKTKYDNITDLFLYLFVTFVIAFIAIFPIYKLPNPLFNFDAYL